MSGLKEKILGEAAGDLAAIEQALSEHLAPQFEVVSRVAQHIMFSGGKRLRPLLMILGARVCGYRGDYATTLSVVFEYLHTATLLHDDLVDGACLRRGKAAAHGLWGKEIAVLVGDFLLARSLSIAARVEIPAIIGIIAKITECMSQGEIRQLAMKGDLSLSEGDYMEIIRYKTAVLIQGACRVGAILAGAPEDLENAMAAYGDHLGTAFQIVDDILDYTADSRVLGKQAGTDLKEGKLTLPVIYALNRAGEADRRRMERIIRNGGFNETDFLHLVEMLHTYGGLSYAEAQARRHVEKAHAALDVFDDSPTRRLLADIASYALERKY